MAVLEVNFTRMNLVNLKLKLAVATKGHRLLKSKVDGMVKKLDELLKQARKLRTEVFYGLRKALENYELAKTEDSPEHLSFLIQNFKRKNLNLFIKQKNVMGVNLPVLKVKFDDDFNFENLDFLLFSSSQHFDLSVKAVVEVFPKLTLLAEIWKSIDILKNEINKVRRKVNALEYLIMPNYVDTIREIGLKLEENERNNIARLSRISKKSFVG